MFISSVNNYPGMKKSPLPKFNGHFALSSNIKKDNNTFSGLDILSNQNKAIHFTGLKLGPGGIFILDGPDYSAKSSTVETRTKRVLSKTRLASVYKDHHEVLKTFEAAKQQGILSPRNPVCLLHLDTHSDLKRNCEPILHIGNWVNTAMTEGLVDEFYWVLPDWTREDKWKDLFWKNEISLNDNLSDGFANVMLDPGSEKTIYLDKRTRKLHFTKPFDLEQQSFNYKPIKFHKVTIDELPKSLKDKPNLALDICGDYFVNNGTSTAGSATNVKGQEETSAEIDRSFEKIFEVLDDIQARPIMYTAAVSKEFIPDVHLQQVTNCLDKIKFLATK